MMFYNELANPGLFFSLLSYLLLLLATAMVWHELGHMWYFKSIIKDNIKIRFKFVKPFGFKLLAGEQYQYNKLTDDQYQGVAMAGVILGTIPIITAMAFQSIDLMSELMLVPYLVGCWKDIKVCFQHS